MVHPAVYAAIVVGGVVIVGLKFYEEYLESRSYEQFQRNRTRYEQEYNRFHGSNNDFDFDDDRDYGSSKEDNEENDPYTIRKRRPYANSNSAASSDHDIKKSIHEDQDQYELAELESSIAERKRRLMAEQAFLDQEEENLRNRKNALMRSYESDDVTSSVNALNQTKFNNSSSNSSSDDEHTLENHMAHFDPFADQFQETSGGTDSEHHGSSNSDSTQIMYVEAEERLSTSQQLNNSAGSNSTELRYPTPRTATPTNSNTNSISEASLVSSPHMMSVSSARGSESEESWDAVSEAEWNQTATDESDNEHPAHHSITSFSEDDDVVRF